MRDSCHMRRITAVIDHADQKMKAVWQCQLSPSFLRKCWSILNTFKGEKDQLRVQKSEKTIHEISDTVWHILVVSDTCSYAINHFILAKMNVNKPFNREE